MRRSNSWYNVMTKIYMIFPTLMAIGIMVVCSLDMVYVVDDTKLEAKLVSEINVMDRNGYQLDKHITPGQPSTQQEGFEFQSLESKNKTVPPTAAPQHNDAAKKKYKIILILCYCAALILGFTQMITSLGVLFGCSPHAMMKLVKTWLLVHSLTVLLGLLCILIPLTVNPQTGNTLSVPKSSEYIQDKFNQLKDIDSMAKFHENMYFYLIGANEVLVAVGLILLSSCYRCGSEKYEEIDFSDNERY